MGRNKLARFRDNAERANIIETGKENFGRTAGQWNSEVFHNDNDLVVEIGCGYGEYSIGLGQEFPQKNFIGVDIKGARLWSGSNKAIALGLVNVAFLRTQVELLDAHFEENELSEIWVTFPDPRPKERDEKRRLTAPRFLEIYKKLLRSEGWIKFKTDNTPLFDYSLEVIKSDYKVKNLSYTYDLYQSDLNMEHYGVKTRYERMFHEKGEDIKYLKFQFDSE